jgi:hypothetical protein
MDVGHHLRRLTEVSVGRRPTAPADGVPLDRLAVASAGSTRCRSN